MVKTAFRHKKRLAAMPQLQALLGGDVANLA
jgi:hypothetical protein